VEPLTDASPEADGIVSAEESTLIGEANREVLAAVRALPARQREAVVLRHYLGLTEEEAAQAMKITRGTSVPPQRLRRSRCPW
jgi:DNA-directed RNA polymerase specialized sigma24 family protein